jgi:RNA polymerase sigma factor (sigma-70 family)
MPQPQLQPRDDVADLVRRCADADADAWDEFVRRFHRRLALYAVRAVRALADAGDSPCEARCDLVQDVYVRLLAHERRALRAWRGDSEQSLLNYLSTIVHAVACDALKRRRSRKRSARLVSLERGAADDGPPLGEQLPASEADSPDRVMLERLAPARLSAALETAERGPQGRRNRLIFMLHAVDGLTANEIARLPGLHVSVANAESAIRRTRERLRFALKDATKF